MKPKIIFADAFNLQPHVRENFHSLGRVVQLTLEERERLLSEVSNAELVIAEYARIDEELLQRGRSLKAVLVYGTGTNHIDLEAAARLGIPVANTKGANANAVAELTFSLMLNCVRRTADAHRYIREKNWQSGDSGELPETFTGTELRNKLLGLIGLGAIGRRVAAIGNGFGMNVCFYDPNLQSDPPPESAACTRQDLDSLLHRSDIVSVHAPLTPATRKLLNGDKLRLMKPSAVLIVTSRGGIVDEEVLADMLERRELAAAGLDVFSNEPLENSSRLPALDNVVLTPHIGGSTMEAVDNISRLLMEQAAAVFSGNRPDNLVNGEELKKFSKTHLSP
ncbi:MAG: hydroxyacid dehydrogenase [Desulfuromonadaceae bacterium]|nr:hydroxyacid dehydrogenase [Desulfuromonadaceae bacterium]